MRQQSLELSGDEEGLEGEDTCDNRKSAHGKKNPLHLTPLHEMITQSSTRLHLHTEPAEA